MVLHKVKPNYELSSARTLQGIPAKQVASFLNQKSPSRIYKWERGHGVPSLQHALLLARKYNKPVEVLFKDLLQESLKESEQRQAV